MKLLKEDFNDILEKQRIKPVFQPIVSLLDGKVIGYEALSRIVDVKEISNSEELFHLAGLYGKVWELEQLCRSKILEKYYSFVDKDVAQKLFINVNPMVIHDKGFLAGFTSEYLNQYELGVKNIVFEVTERNAVDDMRGFKDTVRHYKTQGYHIAVDDAGSCYSGLNLICDIVPHYLKLDISLIHDIHKDTVKYAMVKAMVEFANLANIQLIAEGIECEEELKVLLKLGVHNGQGYFLKRPDEKLMPPQKEAAEIIQRFIKKKNACIENGNEDAKVRRAVLFKLENYKAYSVYCENYGDEKVDAVIKVMQNVVEQNLEEDESATFLDEDTILAVFHKRNCKVKRETIVNMFGNKIREYYKPEDLEKGYIEKINKHGKSKRYPLISICSERVG